MLLKERKIKMKIKIKIKISMEMTDNTNTTNINISSTIKSSNFQKRRKLACVECRQQKSKCDAMERSPDPCTKCLKKNIPCILRKDFKRTYKRVRNEVIERSFKHLTQYLSNKTDKNKTDIVSLWDNNNFTKDKIKNNSDYWKNFIKHIPTTTSTTTTTFIPLILTNDDLKCDPKSLSDISLTSHDISILFNEYASHYHPFLPIVNLKRGPENIYNLSPCLFWVIILTGLRRCQYILNKYKNLDILKRLSLAVKSILAEITISPIVKYLPNENDKPILNAASVYTVQAFLIYTLWPPLTSSLSADTSWNTIGTAMFQALRVGLNSADFSKEYLTNNNNNNNTDLINEQRRTWISCNIVSQFIASSMGFPPYVSFDHSVLSTTDRPKDAFPIELIQMIHISHFENLITKTMNSNPLNPSGFIEWHERFPLLHVLDQQLSQLEFQLNHSNESGLDDIRKFLLYVAKIHLLTYYFTISTRDPYPSTTNPCPTDPLRSSSAFEIKSGLVKVYNSAINLLFHTRAMFQRDPNSIKYFPGFFILNIWQSACIVTKLTHSSISDIIDCKRGEEAYDIAIQLTLNASILKYDMAYRSSRIMRSIWSLYSHMYRDWLSNKSSSSGGGGEFNLDITVSSRMSVSVFFDCLYILKMKCGMAKLKRESGKLQQDLDGIDDLAVSKDVKAAKINARKIIENVPLDPNPIDADTSRVDGDAVVESNAIARTSLSVDNLTNVYSHVASPILLQEQKHDEEPFIKKLSGTSNDPEDNSREFTDVITGPNDTIPQSNDQGVQNIVSTEPQVQLSSIPLNNESLDSTPSFQQRPIERLGQVNNNDLNLEALKEPIERNIGMNNVVTSLFDNNGVQTDTSSYSMIRNFDNWDSEMVWKDVDILMNEFAFNPTV